jgi:hypothetical protein
VGGGSVVIGGSTGVVVVDAFWVPGAVPGGAVPRGAVLGGAVIGEAAFEGSVLGGAAVVDAKGGTVVAAVAETVDGCVVVSALLFGGNADAADRSVAPLKPHPERATRALNATHSIGVSRFAGC